MLPLPPIHAANQEKKKQNMSTPSRTLLLLAAMLAAAATTASADTGACFEVSNGLMQPSSPCYQYVNQVRAKANDIATRPCDAVKPGELPTPSPACCAAVSALAGCECDADVHQIAGKALTIAAVRASQVRKGEGWGWGWGVFFLANPPCLSQSPPFPPSVLVQQPVHAAVPLLIGAGQPPSPR